VTGGQQDTTSGLPLPDDMTGSRSTQNAVLANEHLLDSIGSTNLCNLLDNFGVVVTAVTTNDEERSLNSFWDGQKEGGNEVLGIVFLLEDSHLLAETRAIYDN
jgi:hypothetical protein